MTNVQPSTWTGSLNRNLTAVPDVRCLFFYILSGFICPSTHIDNHTCTQDKFLLCKAVVGWELADGKTGYKTELMSLAQKKNSCCAQAKSHRLHPLEYCTVKWLFYLCWPQLGDDIWKRFVKPLWVDRVTASTLRKCLKHVRCQLWNVPQRWFQTTVLGPSINCFF